MARTCDDDADAFFDFPSTLWGNIYARGGGTGSMRLARNMDVLKIVCLVSCLLVLSCVSRHMVTCDILSCGLVLCIRQVTCHHVSRQVTWSCLVVLSCVSRQVRCDVSCVSRHKTSVVYQDKSHVTMYQDKSHVTKSHVAM